MYICTYTGSSYTTHKSRTHVTHASHDDTGHHRQSLYIHTFFVPLRLKQRLQSTLFCRTSDEELSPISPVLVTCLCNHQICVMVGRPTRLDLTKRQFLKSGVFSFFGFFLASYVSWRWEVCMILAYRQNSDRLADRPCIDYTIRTHTSTNYKDSTCSPHGRSGDLHRMQSGCWLCCRARRVLLFNEIR